ncbi:MAG: V-type ATP synthase subunit D [Spirochaetaceae bacterium]
MDSNTAPTKSNLLRLKDELKFANVGFDLLDQKKKILINEMLSLIDSAIEYEDKVNESLSKAYFSLQEAVLKMGRLKVSHLASVINVQSEIKLDSRKVMGVRLPVVNTEFENHGPYFSPFGTEWWIDSSLEIFKETLSYLGQLSELKISIMKLAGEVKKTIRKVNALEKIAIPDLSKSVHQIENRLEENERENFIIMKMIKDKLQSEKGL